MEKITCSQGIYLQKKILSIYIIFNVLQPKEILGYIDIIDPNQKDLRTEEVKSVTNSFVLYLSKNDMKTSILLS